MRLTLRTLLAWIDGVLPEADQAELAAKVAESPVAHRLIERIREAGDHPDAAVPAGRSAATDPNAVADYLDNVLPADQLEPFERACLESQANLAEVAACHGILAAAARHPDQIVPPSGEQRRRLIRAVAEGLGRESFDAPVDQPASEAAAAAAAIAPLATTDRSAVLAKPPVGEQRASIWAWLAAAAAVAFLAVLGGLLARQIWPAGAARDQHRPQDAAVDRGAPAVPPADGARPDAAALGAMDREEESSITAVGPAPLSTDAELPAAKIPAAAPETSVAVVPLPEMAVASEPTEGAAAETPAVEPAAEPAPSAPGRLAAGDPLLRLVNAGADSRWQTVMAGESLASREDLLAASRCYPVIERRDLMIRLLPGSRVAVTADAAGTPRIEVVFGRVVVWTDSAAGAPVGVSAAGLCGEARIGPRQPLGIEVELIHRPGDDPAAVSPGQRAAVIAGGGVDWRQTEADGQPAAVPLEGIQPRQPLPARSGLRWISEESGRGSIAEPAAEPDWLRQTEPADRTRRAAREAITACLASAAQDGSVTESLRRLANDRRVENQVAAASTLALVGEFDDVVRLLCLEEDSLPLRDAQWRALVAETIPLALGRGVNAAERLRQAFLASGPAGRGEELFQLACGFSATEWAAGDARALVVALEDPLLAVRRFAWAALLPLAAGEPEAGIVYRPDRAAGQNQQGIGWWRAKVKTLDAERAADR
jgi:hypothetical protein